MIHDSIENIELYTKIFPELTEIKKILSNIDIESTLKENKVSISENIFFIPNHYVPKEEYDSVFEMHKKYIDVQVVIKGAERMLFLPKTTNANAKTDYDNDNDLQFFTDNRIPSEVIVNQSQFAIFFAEELHKPACKISNEESQEVIKLVFKVATNKKPNK